MLAIGIVVFDQVSKWLVLGNFEPLQPYAVTEFFNIYLGFNKGAAFGFLSDSKLDVNLVFIVAAIVIICILVVLFWKRRHERSQVALALVLITAGAIGNLIDRFLHGQVVDFLDFYYGRWHFYVFNFADSAITIGAVLLMLDVIGVRLLFRR